MHRHFILLPLAACCSLSLCAAAGGGENPAGAALPARSVPFVPAGERQFMPWEDILPGVGVSCLQLRGNIVHCATTQSAGDGVAMYIYAPPGEPVANLYARDTGVLVKEEKSKVTRNDFAEFKGISLWVKGDGSDAEGVLSWGYTASRSSRFRISLSDKEWRKVFVAWDKWAPPMSTNKTEWLLNFGLERKDHSVANWYIVDRVHYYRDERIEKTKPTPDNDPPGMIAATGFCSGREHLAKTLEKLRARKPLTIALAGDSISCGAQLGYTKRADAGAEGVFAYNTVFWADFARRLERHFPGVKSSLTHRLFDSERKEWSDISIAAEGANLRFVAVAKGGFQTGSMMPHLEQLTNEKPDLVIWTLGCNDVVYGSLDKFRDHTLKAISAFKALGAEVILCTTTPTADCFPWPHLLRQKPPVTYQEKSDAFAAAAREMAREQACALADMHGAFLARGWVFVGDLYADLYHPNHLGHEMMADILDSLVTEREIRIWEHNVHSRQQTKSDKEPAATN